MNRIKSLAFVLVAGVILAACSKDRQDPLGPEGGDGLTEGRLTRGADRPNLLVSSSNSDSACQAVDEEVFSAYVKAGSSFSAGSELAEAVRVTGDYSGYITVEGSSLLTETYIRYNLKLTFYDYSDAGSIFIGGGLRYYGALNLISNHWVRQEVSVQGELKFAGSYSGFITFIAFLIPTDDQGDLLSVFAPDSVLENFFPDGRVKIDSGGNTHTFNPYPVFMDGQ